MSATSSIPVPEAWEESLLLVLTLAVSLVNFSSNRSNYIQGLIHLILFGAYVVLIFD